MTDSPIAFPRSPAPRAQAPEPTLANRVKLLQLQAKSAAAEHVEQWIAALSEAARLGGEIAAGGEVYPVGVREMGRILAEDLAKRAQTLTAIMGRPDPIQKEKRP